MLFRSELANVERITTVVGSRDPMEVIGRLAYPGRTPLLPLTLWNKAVQRGCVHRAVIPRMGHNGSHGPFADSHRDAVMDAVLAALPSSHRRA